MALSHRVSHPTTPQTKTQSSTVAGVVVGLAQAAGGLRPPQHRHQDGVVGGLHGRVLPSDGADLQRSVRVRDDGTYRHMDFVHDSHTHPSPPCVPRSLQAAPSWGAGRGPSSPPWWRRRSWSTPRPPPSGTSSWRSSARSRRSTRDRVRVCACVGFVSHWCDDVVGLADTTHSNTHPTKRTQSGSRSGRRRAPRRSSSSRRCWRRARPRRTRRG